MHSDTFVSNENLDRIELDRKEPNNKYDVINDKVNKLCAWRHNVPPPLASKLTIFAFIRQGTPVPTCWFLKKLTFDLESGVRVTCDVRYLCANFSLPRPLCSRVRPDVRIRQTDVRQTSDKSLA